MGYITDIFQKKKKTATKRTGEDKDGAKTQIEKKMTGLVDREDVMLDLIALKN